MSLSDRQNLPSLLSGLRAAGEETRLRILALLAQGELSVSDLVDILGQSQPRISRHLKLMAEAGLVERHREGAWAFFRLAANAPSGRLGRALSEALDPADPTIASDRNRLSAVRAQRAQAAEAYFSRVAADWDKVRSLHAPDSAVEAAIADASVRVRMGRSSTLAPAPAACSSSSAGRRAAPSAWTPATPCWLWPAPISSAPAPPASNSGRATSTPFPSAATPSTPLSYIRSCTSSMTRPRHPRGAATLAPGGRLIVVDFAAHDLEFLRAEHQHRRLGFAQELIGDWMREAGLDVADIREIGSGSGDAAALTVTLWVGRDRRPAPPANNNPKNQALEIA